MSGKITNAALLVVSAIALFACISVPNRNGDFDYGAVLEDQTAGIWVDGNGCDHWIIDDGIEGYMSPRLSVDGKPVCREGSVPYTTLDFDRSLFGSQ